MTIEFIPTTVEGTSLLVVPAPASIAAMLAAFCMAARRRR
ncbi:MAG: PEP-CTERM sorting domain-containing protein [Phycisphaerales bacterium]